MKDTFIKDKDLEVIYKTDLAPVYAVNKISFDLDRGETLGLVGETGAGKTTTALSLLRLLPERTARIVGGGIEFEGKTSGSSAGSSSSGGSGSSSSAGTAIKLSGAPLYAASTSRVPSTHVTGTYYRWDDEVIRGRVRITNLKSRVGAAGQVTGWIDEKYL